MLVYSLNLIKTFHRKIISKKTDLNNFKHCSSFFINFINFSVWLYYTSRGKPKSSRRWILKQGGSGWGLFIWGLTQKAFLIKKKIIFVDCLFTYYLNGLSAYKYSWY